MLLKCDAATGVAEFADSNKIVFEGRHYFTLAGRDVEEEVGSRGGELQDAGGVADPGGGYSRVDVRDGRGGGQVVIAGTGVGDGCVGDDWRGGTGRQTTEEEARSFWFPKGLALFFITSTSPGCQVRR